MTGAVAYAVCALLAAVALVALLAGLFGGADWLSATARSARVRALASARGWRTSESAAELATIWPGAPFGLGVARHTRNVLHAHIGPLPVTVFDYGYDLPGFTGVVVRSVAVYVVWLPAPVTEPVWSRRGRRLSWRVEHDALVAWSRGPLRPADVLDRLSRLARICLALPLPSAADAGATERQVS